MLLDYFGVFGWISGKMDEINKSRQFQGPTPWHSTVLIHVILLCFSIPLFRGLIYWTNEDPISV